MVCKTVEVPEQMEKKIREIISVFPELGYVSTDRFIEESIRKRVDQIKMRAGLKALPPRRRLRRHLTQSVHPVSHILEAIAPQKEYVLNYLQNLTIGDHAVLFYETPDEKQQCLFTFLRGGLERGEVAVYVAGEEPPEQVRRDMEKFGIEVEECEAEGSLKVYNYDPWYMKRGSPNPPSEIIQNWMKLVEEARAKGKKGIRATSEASLQFIRRGKTCELFEYEASLGRRLQISVVAVCAYSLKEIEKLGSETVHSNIIAAHNHSIFPTAALKLA